jgi:hypothetical protein
VACPIRGNIEFALSNVAAMRAAAAIAVAAFDDEEIRRRLHDDYRVFRDRDSHCLVSFITQRQMTG